MTRTSMDGVPIKAGDRVWLVQALHASVTSRRLQKHEVNDWFWQSLGQRVYANRLAALEAALEGCKRRLKVAQRDVIRERKNVEKFSERLKENAKEL